MPIDTVCPGCQKKLRIGDEFAGLQARCPVCDTIYQVPEATAGPALPPVEESTPPDAVEISPAASPRTEKESGAAAAEAGEAAATAVVELPPPDGTLWYLRTPEGPVYGPVSEADFQRWVAEGRVTPDCAVAPGDNQWHPAPALFPELSGPQPAPVTIAEEAWSPKRRPHRGPFILTLGVLGIITSCPILCIMAWVMGSGDLIEMEEGRMDKSGLGATQAGRLLGMVLTIFWVIVAVIGMFALVLVAARW